MPIKSAFTLISLFINTSFNETNGKQLLIIFPLCLNTALV